MVTITVPQYFFDYAPSNIIVSDPIFAVAYNSIKNCEQISVQNSMHALIMLLHGTKKVITHETDYTITSGDLLLLCQGHYFMSERAGKNGKYEAILIYFTDSFIFEFLQKYNIQYTHATAQKIVTLKADPLIQKLMISYKDYKSLPTVNQIMKLKTEELFLLLIALHKKEFLHFLHAISLSSKEWFQYLLKTNIEQITSVKDMCTLAGLSEQELRKRFQQEFHCTPRQWLLEQRLQKAAFLLKKSNKTINQIAMECHFATSSWFGAQFKKRFGITPSMFREKNR